MKTLLLACAVLARAAQPPATVPDVDLARYGGRWYQIAAFPVPGQKDCAAVATTYATHADGKGFDAVNECRHGGVDGPLELYKGQARVTKDGEKSRARLLVKFHWPFRSDYWILELGKDYDYAVVGGPSRRFFWIIARKPAIDRKLYDAIVSRMPGWGYDPAKLVKTQH